MFRLMRWDWRLLVRSGLIQALLGGWLLLLIAATAFGYQQSAEHRSAIHDVLEDAQLKQRKLEHEIQAGELIASMPLSANATLSLAPGALMDIVAGRSDLEPVSAEVNMWTLTHLMFLNHQTSNAQTLALGRFDLGFVTLYLLPLMIIVLGYSMLTEERTSGLERMLKAHGVSMNRLLLARTSSRGLLVVVPLLLAIVSMYWLSPTLHAERGERLLALVVVVLIYASFWLCLTSWVNARARTDGQALQQLCAVWVVLAMLLPAAIGAWARVAYPAPSRLDLLATARRVEIDATQQRERLLGAYTHDHPNLVVKDAATTPLWQKGVIVVTGAVEAAVAPVRDRFDAQLLKQQRLTEQLQFLSPTLIAQQTLTRISGTDESRYAAVRWQAGNYLYELRQVIGRMAMAGEPLTVERLRSLPKFVQADPLLGTTLRAVAWPLGLLCAVSLVLAGFSRVRLEDQR